jgi:hypothetical protein
MTIFNLPVWKVHKRIPKDHDYYHHEKAERRATRSSQMALVSICSALKAVQAVTMDALHWRIWFQAMFAGVIKFPL